MFNPFNYTLPELKASIIAGIYLVFSILMLFFAFPVGFEGAVVALVGPTFVVIGVFTATEHSAMDLQKALEAFKGAAITILSYYTVVPNTTNEQLTLVIGSIVAVVAIAWARKGVVSRQ